MKNVLIFLISFIFLTISGCSNITFMKDSNFTSNVDQADTTGIKLIGASDFIVSDGSNSFRLDLPYKEFTYYKPEERSDNNYVGEVIADDYVYKTYMHKYPDFDIYVSNLNYNHKNRSFDEYYITQITLKNSNMKTSRGITLGSKAVDVYNTYGSGEKTNVDGEENLSYKFEDMELLFVIDKNQNVKELVLLIKSEIE